MMPEEPCDGKSPPRSRGDRPWENSVSAKRHSLHNQFVVCRKCIESRWMENQREINASMKYFASLPRVFSRWKRKKGDERAAHF